MWQKMTDHPNIQIRLLTEQDIEHYLNDLCDITLSSVNDGAAISFMQTSSVDDVSRFWTVDVSSGVKSGDRLVFGAVHGGKLVGMVTIGDVVNFRLTELEHEALQLKQLIVG